tara:strand:+ start:1348 stop:1602 length:255 start_codon:yes stop_codon:yes gene_type:complete
MSKEENVQVVEAKPTHEVGYLEPSEEFTLAEEDYEEYVYVEEQYCGPLSCCIGSVFFILFWPVSFLVACCPCDKRIVKKHVVRR